MLDASDQKVLLNVLERSRAFGFLGESSVESQIDHALCFAECVPECGWLLDMGSGGGVPGLVIAVARPELALILLDASARRCAFLRWAVTQLGRDGIEVREQRAEETGHSSLRGRIQCVVARSFGPPAVTAECAAPLLEPRGRLLVSEPPQLTAAEIAARWPADGLRRAGLRKATRRVFESATIQELERVGQPEPQLPRAARRMAKAPLF